MSIAEDYAQALSIWDLTGDLADYAEGIGQMFAQLEFFAADTDTTVGWQPLWDVDLAPDYALPWLAQVVGERLAIGLDEATAREQINKTPNQLRGTPRGIVDAVKGVLTGAKRVWFRECFNGSEEDEDAISILLDPSEAPDERAVLNEVRRTVPADIEVDLQIESGPTWGALETPSKTWAELYAAYGSTWGAIEAAKPEYDLYE